MPARTGVRGAEECQPLSHGPLPPGRHKARPHLGTGLSAGLSTRLAPPLPCEGTAGWRNVENEVNLWACEGAPRDGVSPEREKGQQNREEGIKGGGKKNNNKRKKRPSLELSGAGGSGAVRALLLLLKEFLGSPCGRSSSGHGGGFGRCQPRR